MKKIKIKFVDFWAGFDEKNNVFIDLISKNFEIEISDNPDYIIYSVFGNDYLNYNCIRIFFTGENLRPDFNLCDYALGFDYIDFEDRYIRFPLYLMYDKDLQNALSKHKLSDEELHSKVKFCNFVYSNGNADKRREEFFHLLNKYKKVDSGGKYLNNIGEPVEDKFEFQRNYKFSIAFENSSTSGYTTEKLVQAIGAGTIPIYWGNPNIEKEFNTKSFINCHDYESFEDVIERVKEIDNNKELFIEILREPLIYKEDSSKVLNFDEVEKFFYNIFSKNYDLAVKRNNIGRELYYEELVKFKNKIMNELCY